MTTPTRAARERRKAKARRLSHDGLGVREIARKLKVEPSTISRDLAVEAPGSPVPKHAQRDNKRSLKHGTRSERMLAPVRDKHVKDLAERYDHIVPERRWLQAHRLAQIDLGAAWLDAGGGVVRDEQGRVYDVADKVAKWSGAAETWFQQAESERPSKKFAALAEFTDENA